MKVDVNNIAINYYESGLHAGFPIIFIHGFPFSQKMWEPQISDMPDNIRAITYDIRGHGCSDVGDGQFTIELFVDDLIALLDRLNVKQAVLCGLSMGGYIALRAYEKYEERVSGLILCDTKSQSDSNEAKIKRAVTIKTVKESGVGIFAEDFLKTVFWEKTFKNNPALVESVRKMICGNSPISICGTLLALASRTDTTHILSSIAIPVCIIVGEHDKLTPPSAAQEMQKAIAGSELHILSNAGHLSNLENTKDFNERFIAFLEKHW